MQLLVIRHARAESVKEFAKTNQNDDLRPLTTDGRERMRLGAAGLHKLVDEIDVLATSPLVRARQTAEIVAAEFGGLAIVEIDALRPGSAPEAFGKWLESAGSLETIAIVGHNTHLRELVGWLITGSPDAIVQIKKGAAVMLKLSAHRPDKTATLLWSLAPRQLRMLGS
jgi:phosphohistidine phosphatase